MKEWYIYNTGQETFYSGATKWGTPEWTWKLENAVRMTYMEAVNESKRLVALGHYTVQVKKI